MGSMSLPVNLQMNYITYHTYVRSTLLFWSCIQKFFITFFIFRVFLYNVKSEVLLMFYVTFC